MWPGLHAKERPDQTAFTLDGSGAVVTYRDLDERSNRLAQLLYARGLRFGDHIAILMENNEYYLEVAWAAQRSGIYFTPINFHFTAEEAAYIIGDCDAQVLVVSHELADLAGALVALLPPVVETRLVVGGPVAGYESYEEATGSSPAEPLAEELEGHAMMYSSGTTGRPKGIRYRLERKPVGNPDIGLSGFASIYSIDDDTIYLSPAPLYHSAPLQFCIAINRLGGTNVILEHFDPEACLAAIERHRITHAQFVPTMFVRMLKLPAEVRERYDLSSLQLVIHAAAPCPVEIK
ncbi:MAG TPA: AMP-binding protein, partial [Acidimicrobiia bacterium]|nr:AMP-binding protein [Acidimicrobiia bacterium]